MVIKKIFEKKTDEEVHSDLLKFGRGEYRDRYLVQGKKQSDKYSVKTTAEFANFLVRKCLEKVSGKIAMKGVVVSTFDLRNEVDFEIKKVGNFQGIRKTEIDSEIEPEKILALMDKSPRVFFGLSFSTDETILKIKPKAPRSGKPKSKDNEVPKADFCSLKTTDTSLLQELFFDVGLNWKECNISHLVNVQEIVYPKEMKGLKPEEIREQSKRKGVIVRKAVVDGVEKSSESDFEA